MNKILITGCAVATAFAAVAMPTKKELAQAQKPVENATKADLAALKAGKKTARDVAESHLALAKEAKNQAEKYLYYQGAFKLYARSGEYSRAIDTLETLKRDVKDVTQEVIDELVGQELRGVAKEQREQNDGFKADSNKGSSYVWSCRKNNGEAMIVSGTDGRIDGRPTCAVSPKPTGVFWLFVHSYG